MALIRIHRFTEMVTLSFAAIVGLEKLQLLKCLYPFGDHLQMQAVRHADDGTDDGASIRAFRKVVNERPVELERVYRKALQVAQI